MAEDTKENSDAEGENEGYEEDGNEEDLEGIISEVPFEVLQEARSNGASSFRPLPVQKAIPKRANKNRPVEMSSKKPVSRFREVIQAPKLVLRDPRFESLCGNYEESKFKNSYSFLYNEELPAERKRLVDLMQKKNSGARKEQIQRHIKWIDTQLVQEKLRRKRAQKAMEQKQKEKVAVKQGKKPFLTKKSDSKKQELLEKYEELKASGKLEAFLARRRRKNAAKDHRYMPYRRPQAG